MQYSCAYWKDADNLESAWQAKLEMICEKIAVKTGDTHTGYWLRLGPTGALHGI
ncbi:class I SAM-dependent methyltransferase [Escherichia coli]